MPGGVVEERLDFERHDDALGAKAASLQRWLVLMMSECGADVT